MALVLQAVYTVFVKRQNCIEKGYQGGKGEGQWQERKQWARKKWQGRKQNMLDLW